MATSVVDSRVILKRHQGHLHDCWLALWEDFRQRTHTDVVLRAERVQVHCHKLVLASASGLFRRILDPTNPEPTQVTLIDVAGDALERIVSEIYARLCSRSDAAAPVCPNLESFLALDPAWRDSGSLKREAELEELPAEPEDVKPSFKRTAAKRRIKSEGLAASKFIKTHIKQEILEIEDDPAMPTSDDSSDSEPEINPLSKLESIEPGLWAGYADMTAQGQGCLGHIRPYREPFSIESLQKNKRRYIMKRNSPYRALFGLGPAGEKVPNLFQAVPIAWSDPHSDQIPTQFDRFVQSCRALFGFSDEDILFNTKLLQKKGRSSEKVGSIKDHIRRGMLTKFAKFSPNKLQGLLDSPELQTMQRRSKPNLAPSIDSVDQDTIQLEIRPDLPASELAGMVMVVWDGDQKCLRSRSLSLVPDEARMWDQGDYFLSILFDTWCTSDVHLPETHSLEAAFEKVARVAFIPKVVGSLLSENIPEKQCPACGEIFPHLTHAQQAKYSLHKQRHDLESFQCDCDEVFGDEAKKRRHILTKHSNGRYHQCSHCVFIGTSSELTAHLAEDHRNFMCDICGKVLPTKSSASCHWRDLHKDYHCDICNQHLVGYRSFSTHNRKHKGPWTCQACSSVFKDKPMLEKHVLRIHTSDNEKPFQCEVCGKGFIYQRGLDIHMMNGRVWFAGMNGSGTKEASLPHQFPQ
eukprot:maker-scaffold594_size129171-snap-gene-0.22 protein:Tk01961 transcript:maker-scaffold594_size129171-snap-gene-0.22-mRNA-1 annotation:"zinc finger protein 184-like"